MEWYGVWSTPRTCSFFVISFRVTERLFFISMYTTESIFAVLSNRVHHSSFIFAEKGLKLEYPDPLIGNKKWLIDDKRSVKCVFGQDSVMVQSWSGKKSSRIAGVWISSSEWASAMSVPWSEKNKAILLDRFDHDYLHLYSLKSRYDLGTNFPTVPQPE